RGELVDEHRDQRGEAARGCLWRKTRLLSHRLDLALTEDLREIAGRDRLVLSGAHPGASLGSEAGFVELLNEARQTAWIVAHERERQIEQLVALPCRFPCRSRTCLRDLGTLRARTQCLIEDLIEQSHDRLLSWLDLIVVRCARSDKRGAGRCRGTAPSIILSA